MGNKENGGKISPISEPVVPKERGESVLPFGGWQYFWTPGRGPVKSVVPVTRGAGTFLAFPKRRGLSQ